MSTATAENITLKLTRFIKAPRERVFEAWTNPEQLMRWMGPATNYLVSAKTDLRVGGAYEFEMSTDGSCHGESQERTVVGLRGVYKEIKKPSKLVFTWGWVNNTRVTEGETTVTVELAEAHGGTQLTLTHEGFGSEESRDAHNMGWSGTLDKLEHQQERAACSLTPGNFSWNEMITTETDKASAFYTKLFGWQTQAMPGMDYTIFKQGNNYIGGMIKCEMKEVPSNWLPYITVANADESVAAAEKLGAKTVVQPKDIPNVGRIAVLVDPNGASFGVWQQLAM